MKTKRKALLVQRARLQHVERLRQSALAAYQALMGGDNEEAMDRPGAVDLLGQAVSACQDAGKIDPALSTEGDALNTALIQAEESARALRDYLDAVEADPQALERTAERLFLIGDLKRKYGESIREVLAYAAEARQRLGDIEHRSERLAELSSREEELQIELGSAAAALSSRRQAAAAGVLRGRGARAGRPAAGGRSLRRGRCANARSRGLAVGGRQLAVELSGVDRVEFLLAANPGEEPKPMARVASGGELARIALALKTVLSRAETRPTLIFDEIDVGVGGRTAPVVGEKLWAVAAAGHQVLCVTHMPQVAAFADCHYVVARAAPAVVRKRASRCWTTTSASKNWPPCWPAAPQTLPARALGNSSRAPAPRSPQPAKGKALSRPGKKNSASRTSSDVQPNRTTPAKVRKALSSGEKVCVILRRSIRALRELRMTLTGRDLRPAARSRNPPILQITKDDVTVCPSV